MSQAACRLLTIDHLAQLLSLLQDRGYEVIGPTARDGAVVYDAVDSLADLPTGRGSEQEPGRYRLTSRDDGALFGYVLGPQSWKQFLHPAEVRLWSAERQNGAFRILNNEAPLPRPRAFLGVRACELAAIAVLDRVLLADKYRDPIYTTRREGIFLIAVPCTQSAATCFCASMGTGPGITAGADLILTELLTGEHRFLAQAASDRGAELLAALAAPPADASDLSAAESAIHAAATQQTRALEREGLKQLLYDNFEHPRWDDVARRCLTCGNCTMVCPTCFCVSVEDSSDVTGNHAERWRKWDSCFTQSFSYIHGGSVRTSTRARYRQWMTHKLAAWQDQFGTPGCVGCGRCITWCPAGIDITQEARAMWDGGKHGNT